MALQDTRFAKTMEALDAGRTVYFSTHLRVYELNPKVVSRFRKAGLEPVVYSRDHLYIRSGKSLLCADGCRITIAD